MSRRTPAPHLDDELLEFLRLLWAVHHGVQSMSKRMSLQLGVTGPQRLAIRMLGRFPGISAGDLARALHLHPSTLTGVLRRLEERGLVMRRADPADSRRAFLSLTHEGRRLDRPDERTVECRVQQALRGVPPEELNAAKRVLSRLVSSLDDQAAAPDGDL